MPPNWLRKNLFIIGLLAMMALAFVFPEAGAKKGPLRTGILTQIGVVTIFFLQGLSLKTRELARGMRDLRMHAFVQGWIFLLTPLVLIPAGLLLKAFDQAGLSAGFIFLALVPTTISSAIAFSSTAGGNVPAAIFNTTLANILGVFWVPTGCVLLFATSGSGESGLVASLLWKLSWLILMPLFLGQLLRPVVSRQTAFQRLSPQFKNVNQGIILLIVFVAFSESVLTDTWNTIPLQSLVLLLLLSGAAALLIHGGVWISSGWILQKREDRVTALYCGAQKTLAAGAPMAVAIFSNGDQLGHLNLSLILLPLLCYHPIQLFLGALLLPRLTTATHP